jgi:tetratricopeptide (TPR) repeat protein
MSAYEAYNAGNDSDAQKLYKQVLQQDVRNVDALLGMGAIASRQGRIADANGWYGKVLEVDPRNNLAQTALLDNQLQDDQSQGHAQNSESRLKNMLAKRPDDANLHVALGNLYAEQNQWPEAQQAYFEAYSLNSSADNAFNLAVSLDQMGKPKLALPYYRRALEQASSTSSIDKAALAARIAAIQ